MTSSDSALQEAKEKKQMCCCGQPTINGQPGYRWQPTDAPGIRAVSPPLLQQSDILMADEPGRCGGVDSHCYHYRVVRSYSRLFLLVRHGGGDERLELSLYGQQYEILNSLDSNSRYWMLNAIYHAHSSGARKGKSEESQRWRTAAAQKRIKIRKQRGQNSVKVWIESAQVAQTCITQQDLDTSGE